MSQPNTPRPAPKKVTHKLWRGIVQFEEEDVSRDARAFNAFGKSALLWLEHSRKLYRAAHRLTEADPRPREGFTHLLQAPIALMLGAYALETILKMVIVGAHGDTHGFKFDATSAKDFLPTVHNLAELAQRAELRLNRFDRKVLERLTRYSTWAGRYPVPMHYKGYEGPAMVEAVSQGSALFPDEHPLWLQFVALYTKIHKLAVRKTFRNRCEVSKPKGKNAASNGT
jgi:hypothetical protein